MFLRDSFSGFICTYRKIRHSELTMLQFLNIYKRKKNKNYALKDSISKFKYESTHYIGNTSEESLREV